jgi:signal transduction histidine kinase
MSVEILQQQRDEVLRRAESLRQVIELISSELELEPLLTRIVASAIELIGADHGTIGLVVERTASPVVQTAAVVNMPLREWAHEIPPDSGLTGRVLRERQPVRLDRYDELDDLILPEFADHAAIGMPIWWGRQVIGVFSVGAELPHRFGVQDVATLELFARHAAIAIENARRYKQEQRRNERLALIARVGRIITADLLIDDLLQNAADAIHELLGYTYVSLALIDPADPQTLVFGAVAGPYRPVARQEYRLPVTRGITGAAARSRQAVLVNDVSADPRYVAIPGVTDIQAELALPILHCDAVLGVLNLESDARFSEEDVASLRIIADQLAVAIENARLFTAEQQRAARIAAINRVGRLITNSLSLDEIIHTAVAAIREQLEYHNIALLLVDPDDPQTLVLRSYSGIYIEAIVGEYRQPINQGVIGIAAQERQPRLIVDVQNDPRYLPIPGASDIYSELAVPLVFGEQLLGVLNIESRRRITEEDAAGFAIIADQLGTAIENARLFGSLQQALEETRLLYATSQRLSTAMSVDEVIVAYLEQVAARGRYACAVVLLEQDHLDRRTTMVIRGRWSPQRGTYLEEERWPFVNAPFTPLLDAGQTVTFANVHASPEVPTVLRQMQAHAQRPALALIPLMVRGRRIGMVLLSYPDTHAWQETDLQPYQATAAQLATAIDSRQQHRLLAERGQQLAVLEERRRLARELHDSVTQSMFSMSLLSQVIPDLWELDPEEARQSLTQIRDLTRGALTEMRALLLELRPAEADEQSLAQALTRHAAAFEQRTGIAVTLEVGAEPDLPNEVAQALLRIAQEALTNVSRHAQARQVALRVADGPPMRLLIADDGKGFDPAQVAGDHFGLISMRERATRINARLQICSTPGQGTEIIVAWPGHTGDD